MRRELKKLQKENAALAQRVQSGRDTIAHTEQRIAAAVDEWKVTKLGKEKNISANVYYWILILALVTKINILFSHPINIYWNRSLL